MSEGLFEDCGGELSRAEFPATPVHPVCRLFELLPRFRIQWHEALNVPIRIGRTATVRNNAGLKFQGERRPIQGALQIGAGQSNGPTRPEHLPIPFFRHRNRMNLSIWKVKYGGRNVAFVARCKRCGASGNTVYYLRDPPPSLASPTYRPVVPPASPHEACIVEGVHHILSSTVNECQGSISFVRCGACRSRV